MSTVLNLGAKRGGKTQAALRAAYDKGVADERARVVAWLRDCYWDASTDHAASSIERGEHARGEAP